jgi:hypothetical protein
VIAVVFAPGHPTGTVVHPADFNELRASFSYNPVLQRDVAAENAKQRHADQQRPQAKLEAAAEWGGIVHSSILTDMSGGVR